MNRKLLWLFCLLFPLCAAAQSGSVLERPCHPPAVSGTVAELIEALQRHTGIELSYSEQVVATGKAAALHGDERTVEAALRAILAGQEVGFLESNGKILLVPLSSMKKYAVHGYIKDTAGSEVLIGAAVYVPALKLGTVTNNYGYFSLSLPEGRHELCISYTGYRKQCRALYLRQDLRCDLFMVSDNQLQEISVRELEGTRMERSSRLLLQGGLQNRSALSDLDPLRSVQNLTGIQPGMEGSNDILVRGGDPGQNLYLLDNVPLYYIDHLFGISSIYNGAAIKSVDVHKDAFPSRFGERISSVIDVHTRDGNMQRFGAQADLGLVKGSLNLEGPIIRDRASFFVSARRSWLDLITPALSPGLRLNFWDLNGKVNIILNKNNRVYASYYSGRDGYGLYEDDEFSGIRASWGNSLASVKWTRIASPRVFLNAIASFSRFSYRLRDKKMYISTGLQETDSNLYSGRSDIREGSLRLQLHWSPVPQHHVETGIHYSMSEFIPVDFDYALLNGPSPATPVGTRFHSGEVVVYLEDRVRIGERFFLRPGVHWAHWFNDRYYYNSLQPRLYACWQPEDSLRFFVSLSRMGQFLHFISNTTYGLPTDFWIPSTRRIRPESSWMYAAGHSGGWRGLRYSLEAYYKTLEGVVSYASGRTLFDNGTQWEEKILQGRGRCYGLEVNGSLPFGAFSANAGYTLSWSLRQFDRLNGGREFPYRYDRRHNIRLGLSWKPAGSRFDAHAAWIFMSGEAMTLPDQITPALDPNLNTMDPAAPGRYYTYNYVSWNDYRLPPIHRLDLRLNYSRRTRRGWSEIWSAGVFNAYARPNVMMVSLESEDDPFQFRLRGISYFQAVPYVNYRISF